jgi:hypothetical protein
MMGFFDNFLRGAGGMIPGPWGEAMMGAGIGDDPGNINKWLNKSPKDFVTGGKYNPGYITTRGNSSPNQALGLMQSQMQGSLQNQQLGEQMRKGAHDRGFGAISGAGGGGAGGGGGGGFMQMLQALMGGMGGGGFPM